MLYVKEFMEKRLFLAIVLSMSLLLGYQFVMIKLYPPSKVNKESLIVSQKNPELIKEDRSIKSENLLTDLKEDKTIVETKKYSVTLSDIGGCIKEIRLKDYKVNNKPLTLYSSEKNDERISSIFGLGDINNAKFECEKSALVVRYTHRINDKLEIEKKYIFSPDNYGLDLEVAFKNITNNPIKISYDIVGISNIDIPSAIDVRYVISSAKIDGKIINLKAKKDTLIVRKGNSSWLSLTNRYFSLIFKPFNDNLGTFSKESKPSHLVNGIKMNEFEIPSYGSSSNKFFLYAGPNDIKTLSDLKIGLQESINYGLFNGISKALISSLRFFHKFIPNWGISIILLSILVGVILSPLSIISYRSMKKMQELQPHMDKLKKEHKDNPQKFQKETMELYKKYKVNPMSGCLPLILQMPIFFALYSALMKSIELRGSKFLWVKDLSMPDAAFVLPFSLPIIGNSINLLPILMAAAMFLQQKASTMSSMAASEEQRQQQKIMMMLMPIVFGFILYNFPSGLVLYWLTNTIVTFGQQKIVMRSI